MCELVCEDTPLFFNIVRGLRKSDVAGALLIPCKKYSLLQIDPDIDWFTWVRGVVNEEALDCVERIPFGHATVQKLVQRLVQDGWVIRKDSDARCTRLRKGPCTVVFDSLTSAIGLCSVSDECLRDLCRSIDEQVRR